MRPIAKILDLRFLEFYIISYILMYTYVCKEFYDIATCKQKLGLKILAWISASKFFHPHGNFLPSYRFYCGHELNLVFCLHMRTKLYIELT